MASYQGHLTFSSMLGAAYGGIAAWQWNYDWGEAFLGAGVTTLGGLLPDLDSDSGVPVRELFGLAAVIVPLACLRWLRRYGFTPEQNLVILAGIYVFVRYGVANFFRRITVHRGMYHSIPALLISGLATYLLYERGGLRVRLYLAFGVMLGFLSHLVLDEICSVDFNGLTLRLNKYAGSAIKLFSPSWGATLVCYLMLAGLGYLAWDDWLAMGADRERWNAPFQQVNAAGSARPAPGGGP